MRRVFARSVAVWCAWLCILAATPIVRAQTWTGLGANDDWSTGTNWSTTPTAPANDGTADIAFGDSPRLTPNVDVAWSIKSLTFNNTSGLYVIGGSALTIGSGGITNSNSDLLATIDNDVSVGATQSWTANTGDLSFTGGVVVINTLTVTGAKNTTFSGALSGTGGLIKDGAGTLTMAGTTGGFTGGVTLNNGILKNGPLGGLPENIGYTIHGGTLDLNGNDLTLSTLFGDGGTVSLNSANLTISGTMDSNWGGVFSGDGGLIKSGTSTFEFFGANTYTGGTTVTGGNLQGTATSLQGDIGITNNAKVTFIQAGTGTYAGVISGAGSVAKIGTGTIVLTGLNTYTDGTTVTDGTLQGDTDSLQGSNASTSIDVTSPGKLSFTQDFDGSFLGVVSGTGGMIKDGTGTVSLTAANTYTGGTTITGGTLQIGDATTTGSLDSASAVTIASGATLAFNRSDVTPVNFNNNVGGAGGLHQVGTATIVLGGTNTFTGGSTIDAGTTLQVGDGGTNGTSGSGPIQDNGTLIFDRSDTVTANNNISGTGVLIQNGAGTLILGGTNSYTGGTSVAAGTLQGTTSSLQGSIATAAAASVIFDQTTTGTYAGVISGPGSLTKNGTGTVEFSGANTYSGGTTVNDGVLNVNGSVAGNVFVTGTGTLGGTGTVAGNVDNEATVAPGSVGSPIDTLHVGGTYTNESGATLQVNIDSNQNGSVLNATGAATINGGTVLVNSITGSANAGQKFTFLTASSVTGVFDDATTQNLPPFLIPILGYTSDTAFFTLLRNGETYEAVGRTFNERAVGRYLDQISPTASGDLQTVFDALNSIDDPELRFAESQMAGALHGTLGQIGVQNTTLIVGQVAQRLRSSSMTPTVDPCCCQCNGCNPDICSGCLEHSLFAPCRLVAEVVGPAGHKALAWEAAPNRTAMPRGSTTAWAASWRASNAGWTTAGCWASMADTSAARSSGPRLVRSSTAATSAATSMPTIALTIGP